MRTAGEVWLHAGLSRYVACCCRDKNSRAITVSSVSGRQKLINLMAPGQLCGAKLICFVFHPNLREWQMSERLQLILHTVQAFLGGVKCKHLNLFLRVHLKTGSLK